MLKGKVGDKAKIVKLCEYGERIEDGRFLGSVVTIHQVCNYPNDEHYAVRTNEDKLWWYSEDELEILTCDKVFNIGDEVILNNDVETHVEGTIGKVVGNVNVEYDYLEALTYVPVVFGTEQKTTFVMGKFLELLKKAETDKQSIEKPILEERKIGKVKMELFDEGFPNAILEIAKVMTWAGENKGYKPHDWKNLPDADTQFAAAASRHKLKALIQKDLDIAPLDRTDEESGIVHLAHIAFNVLAELELVLTGRIKK